MVAETEVAVIGSGVMAGAVAWELARAGWRPTLVPMGGPSLPEIGHVASSPAMAYAEAVRGFGHPGAREIWEVYRESHERLRSFLAGLPHDCGYRQRGAFLLAVEREGAALLAASEDMLRDDGFAGEFLDHYMLEMRLALFGFGGGYWAADDAEVDASRLALALRESAEERGATVVAAGRLREVVADASGTVIVGEDDRVRATRVVVAHAEALPLVDPGWSTRMATRLEAGLIPELPIPSLGRSGDGRFGWQASEVAIRLEMDHALDVDSLVARLPVREPSAPRERRAVVVADRLPVVGPARDDGLLALACAAEPCGIAFAAARWVSDWLRTGRDPTPGHFRALSRRT
jgi:glycine/D-amino acid oxidase-like deaminating enzyme